MEMQNLFKIGFKESLTKLSFGWKCFGIYNKDREFYTFKKNMYMSSYANQPNGGESVLLIDILSQTKLME